MKKKIVVLGAGESGVGAALLAKQEKYSIFVSDRGKIKDSYKKELEDNNIPFEEGKHTIEKIFEATEVVKSPGIPDKVPLIKELVAKGIPVISEIEFAAKHTNATVIGITGSNGKTTTANLTYHLLSTAGLNVGLGGNVGYSFARLLTENSRDFYVLELSSFQLDGIRNFRPDIAILLNITPDHLDRYEYKMANYVRSKFRIILKQTDKDLFIYNALDPAIKSYLEGTHLSQETIPVREVLFDHQHLTFSPTSVFELSKCSLKGQHNMFNSVCAIQVAKRLELSDQQIQEGLDTFENSPHRMEVVATINGVEYINDSKATNIDAVYYALLAMDKPIVWIAGGIDKGNIYSTIENLVEEKVKAVICLGVDNKKIMETFSKSKTIEETQDVIEAVQKAASYAKAGDIVLLSPACSSFDLFDNYIDRGNKFKQAVLNFGKTIGNK